MEGRIDGWMEVSPNVLQETAIFAYIPGSGMSRFTVNSSCALFAGAAAAASDE